jgi:hypothetical protein
MVVNVSGIIFLVLVCIVTLCANGELEIERSEKERERDELQ